MKNEHDTVSPREYQWIDEDFAELRGKLRKALPDQMATGYALARLDDAARWAKESALQSSASAARCSASALPGFRGDTDWIHALEGHNGFPYWPKGGSGVTLDPGFDLGQNDTETLRDFYGDIFSAEELVGLEGFIGLKGSDARDALDGGRRYTRISRDEAKELFPLIAASYWEAIVKRFPRLDNIFMPPEMQTAMLSAAYNMGASASRLNALHGPIQRSDWKEVGRLVQGLQQDHKLESIRIRRRKEGALILDAVAILEGAK